MGKITFEWTSSSKMKMKKKSLYWWWTFYLKVKWNDKKGNRKYLYTHYIYIKMRKWYMCVSSSVALLPQKQKEKNILNDENIFLE